MNIKNVKYMNQQIFLEANTQTFSRSLESILILSLLILLHTLGFKTSIHSSVQGKSNTWNNPGWSKMAFSIVLFFTKDKPFFIQSAACEGINVNYSRSDWGEIYCSITSIPQQRKSSDTWPVLGICNNFSLGFYSLLKKHLPLLWLHFTPGFPFPLSGCVISHSKGI